MKFIHKILNSLSGIKYQNFWNKIYDLSLSCMNIGGGGDFESSGEKYAIEFLKEHIFQNKSPLLFDVGANVGGYTQKLLDYVHDGKIHSFEPAKETYRILCENIQNPNVILNNLAISNVCAESILYYDTEGSGLASLYERQLDYFGISLEKSENVLCDTLDHYCSEKAITYIDFLKMDIEGNELNALYGAKNMLESNRIGAIQIEFGGCNIDSRTYFRDYWNLLNNKFFVYRIVKDGLLQIEKYDEKLEVFACTNYFFVRKDIYKAKRL